MGDPSGIEALRPDHSVAEFGRGREELNRLLVRFALVNQQAGTARAHVAASGPTVVGHNSLAVGEVAYDDAPGRLSEGLARHPVPIMLLARLAIHKEWRGRGLGAGPLKDAMRRTLQAAEIAGIRAFAVHAQDEDARCFHEAGSRWPLASPPLRPIGRRCWHDHASTTRRGRGPVATISATSCSHFRR